MKNGKIIWNGKIFNLRSKENVYFSYFSVFFNQDFLLQGKWIVRHMPGHHAAKKGRKFRPFISNPFFEFRGENRWYGLDKSGMFCVVTGIVCWRVLQEARNFSRQRKSKLWYYCSIFVFFLTHEEKKHKGILKLGIWKYIWIWLTQPYGFSVIWPSYTYSFCRLKIPPLLSAGK